MRVIWQMRVICYWRVASAIFQISLNPCRINGLCSGIALSSFSVFQAHISSLLHHRKVYYINASSTSHALFDCQEIGFRVIGSQILGYFYIFTLSCYLFIVRRFITSIVLVHLSFTLIMQFMS